MNVNGVQSEVDNGRGTMPAVINSRTMVPVRFVAENFGFDVEWKQSDKRIIIQ